MEFGEKLKDLRRKRKLTQDEVASSIGVSRRAYIAYEQENVRPRKQETYEKIAKTLGCDIDYLRSEDSAFNTSPFAMVGTFVVSAAFSVAAAYVKLKENNKKASERVEESKESLTTTSNIFLEYEKKKKRFAATAMGILYKAAAEKGIQCQQGNVRDLDSVRNRPDDYIIVKNQKIESWWLIYWVKDQKFDEYMIMFPEVRATTLISHFVTEESDPKRMVTMVVDDIELFEDICRYKGHNSYRGNLSVVLVDTEDVVVCKEEIIATFDEDHPAEGACISVI